MGRADAYDAALLDVAQDHLLYLLAEAGVFDDGSLTFKGGTSLRKCRLGNDGRFSTDLDFAAPDEDVVLAVCAIIDGNQIGGFQYRLEPSRDWDMKISHPTLGSPAIAASAEFARRPIALEPELLGFVPLPIHRHYGFALPRVPVVAEAEACAEKLARYRRTSLGRDLYDLRQFADRSIDEALVRRLWVLKVWGDVVDDHRSDKPLDPADTLRPRRERDFHPGSLRVLTRPVDIPGWEARVRTRFQFIADLDADETRWATCDPRHRSEVDAALAGLAT
jgi:uncharacterized protein